MKPIITIMSIVVFFLVITVYICGRVTQVCTKASPIISVGGCDKDGRCGVMLANGQRVTDILPVVGEGYCLNYEYDWRK